MFIVVICIKLVTFLPSNLLALVAVHLSDRSPVGFVGVARCPLSPPPVLRASAAFYAEVLAAR